MTTTTLDKSYMLELTFILRVAYGVKAKLLLATKA